MGLSLFCACAKEGCSVKSTSSRSADPGHRWPAPPGRAPGRHHRSPVTRSWGRRFPIEPVGRSRTPMASPTRKRSRVDPAAWPPVPHRGGRQYLGAVGQHYLDELPGGTADHRSPAAGAAGSPSSRSAVPGRRWPALPGRAHGRALQLGHRCRIEEVSTTWTSSWAGPAAGPPVPHRGGQQYLDELTGGPCSWAAGAASRRSAVPGRRWPALPGRNSGRPPRWSLGGVTWCSEFIPSKKPA